LGGPVEDDVGDHVLLAVGHPAPAGVGKALLAFSGPELTEELPSGPLPSLTPYSITVPNRLRVTGEKSGSRASPTKIRRPAPGVSCIPAPAFAGDTTVAALSVGAGGHAPGGCDALRVDDARGRLGEEWSDADTPAVARGSG
jgi:hypothetical protein